MITKRDGFDFSPLQHNLQKKTRKNVPAIEKLHLQMSQVRTQREQFAATAKGSNINTANIIFFLPWMALWSMALQLFAIIKR